MAIAIATGSTLNGRTPGEAASPGEIGKWECRSENTGASQQGWLPNFRSLLLGKDDGPGAVRRRDGDEEDSASAAGPNQPGADGGHDLRRKPEILSHRPATEAESKRRGAETESAEGSPTLAAPAPNLTEALLSLPIPPRPAVTAQHNESTARVMKSELTFPDSRKSGVADPSSAAADTKPVLAGAVRFNGRISVAPSGSTTAPPAAKGIAAAAMVTAANTSSEKQAQPILTPSQGSSGYATPSVAATQSRHIIVPILPADPNLRHPPQEKGTVSPVASSHAPRMAPSEIPQTQPAVRHTLSTRLQGEGAPRPATARQNQTRGLSGEPLRPSGFPTSATIQPPREPSVVPTGVAPARNLSTPPAAAHSRSSTGDAFAALDAASGPSKPSWIPTTPGRAEGGFHDPALGWVGVRAQWNTDGLHAVVVPASAGAEQTLDNHLAGLEAHLAEKHIPVHSLSVTPPDAQSASQTQSGDSGEGQHRQGQQSTSGEPGRVPREPRTGAPELPATGSSPGGENSQGRNLRGLHISLVA